MTHILLMEDEGFGDELFWDIEHPDDCPTRIIYEHPENPDWSVIGHDCLYEWEVSNIGKEAFILKETYAPGLPTTPGRYLIEWKTNGEKDDWFESWIEVGERISE